MSEPIKVGQVTFQRLDGGKNGSTIVINVNGREAHLSHARWLEIVAQLQAD